MLGGIGAGVVLFQNKFLTGVYQFFTRLRSIQKWDCIRACTQLWKMNMDHSLNKPYVNGEL